MLASFNNRNNIKPKRDQLFIFGSTGSIGDSTLKILKNFNVDLQITGLSCNSNWEKFLDQIIALKPKYAAISCKESGALLLSKLKGRSDTELFIGDNANFELSKKVTKSSITVAAISGFMGLESTLNSLQNGARVLLANKEAIVAGAHLIAKVLENNSNSELIPIDSEHSAIFQLIDNEKSIKSITLTASGGPFFRKTLEELENVTLEDALKHPSWNMGKKITIDSATMVNKALEVIEASYLFGFKPELIDVVIHPGSIVHGLINLECGTQLLHASYPDMILPIAYGLTYPTHRISGLLEKLDLVKLKRLEFYELCDERFPAVSLAKQCINNGISATTIFNSANEIAVEAFINKDIAFKQITNFIEFSLERTSLIEEPSFDDLIDYHNNCSELLNLFIRN
jgi:1-deoxy-D-xylulose-5-phosphate reductoisomerase